MLRDKVQVKIQKSIPRIVSIYRAKFDAAAEASLNAARLRWKLEAGEAEGNSR